MENVRLPVILLGNPTRPKVKPDPSFYPRLICTHTALGLTYTFVWLCQGLAGPVSPARSARVQASPGGHRAEKKSSLGESLEDEGVVRRVVTTARHSYGARNLRLAKRMTLWAGLRGGRMFEWFCFSRQGREFVKLVPCFLAFHA